MRPSCQLLRRLRGGADGGRRQRGERGGPDREVDRAPVVRVGERRFEELGALIEVRDARDAGLQHHQGEGVADRGRRDAPPEPRDLRAEGAITGGPRDEGGHPSLVGLVRIGPGRAPLRLARRLDGVLLDPVQGDGVERVPGVGPQREQGLVGGQLLTGVR